MVLLNVKQNIKPGVTHPLLGFWIGSNQDARPSSTLSSKYGHLWFLKNKMATAVTPKRSSSNQTNRWRHGGFTLGVNSSEIGHGTRY